MPRQRETREGRRRGRIAALLLVVVAFALVFSVVRREKLSHALRSLSRTNAIIAARLVDRHGVVFYADLDQPISSDRVSLTPISCVGAPRVPTSAGFGRRILPRRKKSCIFGHNGMVGVGCNSSVSMALAPDSLAGRQELLNAANSGGGLVLCLDGNRVVASLHSGTNRLELAAVWPPPPGELVRVAVTLSDERATLFLNGRAAAAADLPEPVPFILRRWTVPINVHDGYSGVIDEFAVWNRSLSEREVRSVCAANCNLRRHYEPLLWSAAAVARTCVRFGSALLRSVDRLHPFRSGPAAMREDCPLLILHTKSADERHFLHAHERSLSNGYRTSKAANFRSIGASFNRRTFNVEAGLDDIYGRDLVCRRPAFLLRGNVPELMGEGGVARLYPPEAHSIVHPDASDILPLNARYVRLYEDRAFKGIYVIEPFAAPGSAWMARGETNKALYFNGRPKLSDLPPSGLDAQSAINAASRLALSDSLFPWSAIELRARRRQLAKRREILRFKTFVNPVAPVEAILGDNPAPMFITKDLSILKVGAGVEWASSDPETISREGAVTRPEGNIHRIVVLTATDRETGACQKYRLRVMARERTLHTVFLSIGDMPTKECRHDFTATILPCDGSPAINLNGLVGYGGGLRHRGNSAYISGTKRSMSLKFETPVAWPDPDHPARRILLCSGRADPSRLKNKLSFDLYRAVFAAGDFPAPRYDFCELFINGEWMGAWEACGSIRDLLPEGSLLYKVRDSKDTIWSSGDTSFLDCATHPPELDGDPYAPVSDFFSFVAFAPPDRFASESASWLYPDNIAGFFLILNFTGNVDGVNVNQYIARRAGDSRFLIVPWDNDEIFRFGGRLLYSRLITRMFGEFPGFDGLVAARWRELRAGALSDESVFGRIDADAARLAPYMDEEWCLLKPAGFDGDFAAAVDGIREAVRSQLDFMDGHFGK